MNTFSKLVIMFDSDVIAVPWRENVLIIFLHKKKRKMNRKWKWVDEWRDWLHYLKLVRWRRRKKRRDFIGTRRDNRANWWFHWNKSCNFGRECQRQNTNVTAPIASTTLYFYFSLHVWALDFTQLYKLFFLQFCKSQ